MESIVIPIFFGVFPFLIVVLICIWIDIAIAGEQKVIKPGCQCPNTQCQKALRTQAKFCYVCGTER